MCSFEYFNLEPFLFSSLFSNSIYQMAAFLISFEQCLRQFCDFHGQNDFSEAILFKWFGKFQRFWIFFSLSIFPTVFYIQSIKSFRLNGITELQSLIFKPFNFRFKNCCITNSIDNFFVPVTTIFDQSAINRILNVDLGTA